MAEARNRGDIGEAEKRADTSTRKATIEAEVTQKNNMRNQARHSLATVFPWQLSHPILCCVTFRAHVLFTVTVAPAMPMADTGQLEAQSHCICKQQCLLHQQTIFCS